MKPQDVETNKLQERRNFRLLHDPMKNGSLAKMKRSPTSVIALENTEGEVFLKRLDGLAAEAAVLDSQAIQLERLQKHKGPILAGPKGRESQERSLKLGKGASRIDNSKNSGLSSSAIVLAARKADKSDEIMGCYTNSIRNKLTILTTGLQKASLLDRN